MECRVCDESPRYLHRSYVCKPCCAGANLAAYFIDINHSTFHGVTDYTHIRPSQCFANCLRCIKEMKVKEEEHKEKLAFLSSLFDTFKQQIHTDVELMPDNDGPPIRVHKALLATRSRMFRSMLYFKESQWSSNERISIPELSYAELDSFVEFLYTGHLSEEKLKKHATALSIAAHKYEISFLKEICEEELLSSLNSSNALDAVNISRSCLMSKLNEAACIFIPNN